MSSIERTASTCADPDLICLEIDRWQALRSETRRLQNACEHISWAFVAIERDFPRELHVLDLALRVTSHDATVSSHPRWRGAVINNIVGNPVPHTDAGEVSIESKTCNADWVHTVHDAGPGMGHEDLRRASHSVPQPRLLGTGLHQGLSIVRRAVELLGRNMFDHQGARARTAWEFLVRLALHSYVRFGWVLEYILK
jgi:signal transduction histidine kinase